MHRKRFAAFLVPLFSLAALLVPQLASAHEVYVLSPAEIQAAIAAPSVPFMTVLSENIRLFSFWALIGIFAVVCVLLFSINRRA